MGNREWGIVVRLPASGLAWLLRIPVRISLSPYVGSTLPTDSPFPIPHSRP